jgi:hypothetical protein
MKLLERWETLTPRSQRIWKAIATLLLLVFLEAFLAVKMVWEGKFEKRHYLTVWRIINPLVIYLVIISIRKIWRKRNEEIDEENTGKKWRLWRRIAQTVIVVLSFLVLLAVWPSVGLGIGLVAVATVLIIKTWTDR